MPEEFSLHILDINNSHRKLYMWEKKYCNHRAGVIFLADDWRPRERFAFILLRQDWAAFYPSLPPSRLMIGLEAGRICKLFESVLLYQTLGADKWLDQGRHKFLEQAQYYVHRRRPVRFCLPAFPCKSTNPDKTASRMPDGAEFEALKTLKDFCIQAKRVYSPGCIIDIVSDGHVFSDCVGTSDDVVTDYTKALRSMLRQVWSMDSIQNNSSSTQVMPIRFHSLNTFLCRSSSNQHPTYTAKQVRHPVLTRINEKDDDCRRMLMDTCGTSAQDLYHVIKTHPDHGLTCLYRGFSKFMYEDLKASISMSYLSKKQKVLTANAVALEMIRRNQAYSHLVELVMPRHIRLSIHAHNNSGPKFAIHLLPPSRFQAGLPLDMGQVGDLGIVSYTNDIVYEARQHLHICTPWHGVLVEIRGYETILVCKAGMVEKQLKREDSPWSKESRYIPDHERGGRYILIPK